MGRFVEAIRITYDVVPNEKAILGSRGVYSNGSNGSSLDLDSESNQYIVDVKSDQYIVDVNVIKGQQLHNCQG